MRLTTFSDYALRVLMYLGANGGELATIGDIASAYGISANHLMKVVHRLAQGGYVETLRGKGGGMRLARRPEAIGLGALLRDTEEKRLVECFDGASPGCRLEGSCVLRGVLSGALEAFFAVLDRYTLADLLGPRRKLAKLLVIAPPPAHGRARRASP
ncbi:MAG TPA: Rrf2 family transcriptional regulator [Usitatibacter sp.]|nr:Rrf2 family transcriptional regulator [Usitatibacter sp.]